MDKLVTATDVMRFQAFLTSKIDEQKEKPPKVYKCDICNDKGFITITDSAGVKRCGECECKKAERYKRIITKSGLENELETMTFDNFQPTNNETRYAKDLAIEFTKDIQAKGLMILGVTGTGKTHLCTAVSNHILNVRHKSLLYVRYKDIVTEIKALTLSLDDRIKAMRKYLDPCYLYIDDLYKNTQTDADKSIMYEIIDYRYQRGLGTIVTSEYNISDLARIDRATITRLGMQAQGYIAEIKTAKSYREKIINETIKNKKQEITKKWQ